MSDPKEPPLEPGLPLTPAEVEKVEGDAAEAETETANPEAVLEEESVEEGILQEDVKDSESTQ